VIPLANTSWRTRVITNLIHLDEKDSERYAENGTSETAWVDFKRLSEKALRRIAQKRSLRHSTKCTA
jgi:hypothetical protein